LTHERVYVTNLLHANCPIEYFERFVAWYVKQVPHSFCICRKTFFDFPIVTAGSSFDFCCVSVCCDEIA
jgi:hypothetical protein